MPDPRGLTAEPRENPPFSTARRNNSFNDAFGFFSVPFEKFREDTLSEWTGALTLLDTIETFFDSRLDLLERRLKKHGDMLKFKAEEAFKRTRTPIQGDMDFDKEIQKFKLKVSQRMTALATTWHSTKVVRTVEKVSFFFGVMNLLMTALMFGMAPQYLHLSYTAQILVLLPWRAYTYKKKQWHYFLFDLCYFCQLLFLAFIWIAPWSPTLLLASYCLAHGSLASAVITWRNSLVFHDGDKITSLFIHPPLVFTVIRHYYPNAEERFPALLEVPQMQPVKALWVSGLIYLIWQSLYWQARHILLFSGVLFTVAQFVLVARRTKIESGLRTTSFSFLLNDKRGVIGRWLGSVPIQWREASFMAGQLVYALVTEIPCVFLLYDHKHWSGFFLFVIFSVSVWNGGGFYIEVFGRKFERELEALRKELAISEALRSSSTGGSTPALSEDEASSATESPVLLVKALEAEDHAKTE